jgi:hypothetical protein
LPSRPPDCISFHYPAFALKMERKSMTPHVARGPKLMLANYLRRRAAPASADFRSSDLAAVSAKPAKVGAATSVLKSERKCLGRNELRRTLALGSTAKKSRSLALRLFDPLDDEW